ncbi:MAG: dUTP diphosphatase, partial [Candidatus Wallbacteria bacterium]|nr:dUTP diphosphatase [Candidatus Wallbacteria bacterium]
MQTVPIKLHKRHEKAVVPRYAHEGDAGFDLCFASEESVTLE